MLPQAALATLRVGACASAQALATVEAERDLLLQEGRGLRARLCSEFLPIMRSAQGRAVVRRNPI